MSGVYNNWIKVNNPTTSNNNVQMESGGFQPPFYFGGSPIPQYLPDNNVKGKGIYKKIHFKPEDIRGKIVPSTSIQNHNIHIPRNMKI